jgi:hypothetical protein
MTSMSKLCSGQGFIIWVKATNWKARGVVTWAETAVVEVSPAVEDAWHFPTRQAAWISICRALGPAIKGYAIAIHAAGK